MNAKRPLGAAFAPLTLVCVALGCSAPKHDAGTAAGGSGFGGNLAGLAGQPSVGGASSDGGSSVQGGPASGGEANGGGTAGGAGGAGGSKATSGGATGTGGERAAAGGSVAMGGRAGSAGAASGGTASAGRGGASAGGAMSASGGRGGASSGGSAGTGNEGVRGPCDVFASASPATPCVAAHSTVRALFGAYSGKLYQVRRSDDATKDITTLSAGGVADGAAQDTFCAGSTCVITVVYDQSGKGNDLWYQGSAAVPGSPKSSPAKAATESLMVSGHKAYSLYINPGNSYWHDGSKSGVPTGSQPEGIYMVTSGTHFNGGCCFDYGNSETTRKADAAGAMDAIYFGSSCWFKSGTYVCAGTGPWVQADLEWGLFASDSSKTWNTNQVALTHKYVTAMLKNNGTSNFAIKGGNAQAGAVTTLYDGKLPGGYSPMKKQGAIVLGSGGDCCKPDGGANDSAGTFYEGAIVAGYPSDATDVAIQANIVAAGYGASTKP